MTLYSPEVQRVLMSCPERMPLAWNSNQKPEVDTAALLSQPLEKLFPAARNPPAALAGLLLRAGAWNESHAVAQEISSEDGSYWHGILHRMEPDFFNASYWFRRVGTHPVFPELFRRATQILKAGGPAHWKLANTWDPFRFIEWCDEAQISGAEMKAIAAEIQMKEWGLLFEWCAIGRVNKRS